MHISDMPTNTQAQIDAKAALLKRAQVVNLTDSATEAQVVAAEKKANA